MKCMIYIILFSVLATTITAQIVELDRYHYKGNKDGIANQDDELTYVQPNSKTFTTFKSGMFEVLTNGKLQTSVQAIEIRIGEKGQVPIFLSFGATTDVFGNLDTAGTALETMINPLGGLINLTTSFKQVLFGNGKTEDDPGLSNLTLNGQLIGKIFSSKDTLSIENNELYTADIHAGLRYQTMAYTDVKKPGIFWIQVRGMLTYGLNPDNFKKTFSNRIVDDFFLGYSVDIGITLPEIGQFNFGLYKYVNKNLDVSLNPTVAKLSLNYDLSGRE